MLYTVVIPLSFLKPKLPTLHHINIRKIKNKGGLSTIVSEVVVVVETDVGDSQGSLGMVC